MKTLLTLIFLALLRDAALEEVKVKQKRGLTFGYGQFNHLPFDAHSFTSHDHGHALRYINNFKHYPISSNLIQLGHLGSYGHQSYEALAQQIPKFDEKQPLGGPIDLGNYVHVSSGHGGGLQTNGALGYSGQGGLEYGGHYAPKFMSQYNIPLNTKITFAPYQNYDFNALNNGHIIQEPKSLSPVSIELPKPILSSQLFGNGNNFGGQVELSHGSSLVGGGFGNVGNLENQNGPVRTIGSYAQSGNAASSAQSGSGGAGYSLNFGDDKNQGNQQNSVLSAEVSSGFLNFKDIQAPNFGVSLSSLRGTGYEVMDELADKVPNAPPLPPIQRQPPPAPAGPVSVAKALVSPGPRVGPVTFTPQTTIGSGGLGIVQLPNGGLVLGSGSYSYSQNGNQQAPAQAQGQAQVQAQPTNFLPSPISLQSGFQPSFPGQPSFPQSSFSGQPSFLQGQQSINNNLQFQNQQSITSGQQGGGLNNNYGFQGQQILSSGQQGSDISSNFVVPQFEGYAPNIGFLNFQGDLKSSA